MRNWPKPLNLVEFANSQLHRLASGGVVYCEASIPWVAGFNAGCSIFLLDLGLLILICHLHRDIASHAIATVAIVITTVAHIIL